MTSWPTRVSHNADLQDDKKTIKVTAVNGDTAYVAKSTSDATKWLDSQTDPSQYLCVDVEVFSRNLHDLNVVVIDLPGYPDRNPPKNDAVWMRIQPFLAPDIDTQTTRVDIVAYPTERQRLDFSDLDRFGMFEDPERSPKLVHLVNTRSGSIWNTKCKNYATEYTVGELTKEELCQYGQDIRMENIRMLWDYAFPSFNELESGTQVLKVRLCQSAFQTIGKRMNAVCFGVLEHPNHPEMRGERLCGITYEALSKICEAVRLDYALNSTVTFLQQSRQIATEWRLAANIDIQAARSAMSGLVDSFNTISKIRWEGMGFIAMEALEEAFEEEWRDDIHAALQKALTSSESDISAANVDAGKALNGLVLSVLSLYDSECCDTTKSLLGIWEDTVESSKLDPSVKKYLMSDVAERRNNFVYRTNDVPDAPQDMDLFARYVTDGDLRKIATSIGDNSDFKTFVDSFESVLKKVIVRVTEQADLIRKGWKNYSVYGTMCDIVRGSTFRRPKKDAAAAKTLKQEQDKALKLCKGLKLLLKVLKPAMYSTTGTSQQLPRTLSEKALPRIGRAAARQNDMVLERPIRHQEPQSFGEHFIPRPEDVPQSVLARVSVDPPTDGKTIGQLSCTQVDDETIKTLQQISTPVDATEKKQRVHPVFIISKLRGGFHNNIVPTPSLYARELAHEVLEGDVETCKVIVVVDAPEEEVYLSLDNSAYFISIKTADTLPLNVGRKRQVVKVIAEQLLNLTCYWVIDDDFKHFVEVEPAGLLHPRSTTLRCLIYTQNVLADELRGGTNDNQDIKDLKKLRKNAAMHLFNTDATTLALTEEQKKSLLVENDRQNWYSVDGDLDKVISACGFGENLLELRSRHQLRTAQVSVSVHGSYAARSLQKISTMSEVSHINRAQLYGCVLFHAPACKGIDYMTPTEFYAKISADKTAEYEEQARTQLSGTNVEKDQKKEALARAGFKHEDWHLVRKLKAANRAHYIVFRFAVVDRILKSIVDGQTKTCDTTNIAFRE